MKLFFNPKGPAPLTRAGALACLGPALSNFEEHSPLGQEETWRSGEATLKSMTGRETKWASNQKSLCLSLDAHWNEDHQHTVAVLPSVPIR